MHPPGRKHLFRFIQSTLDTFCKVNDQICLDENESLHLTKVLRLQEGDSIEVTNGQGVVAKANIVKPHKTATQIEITALHQEKPPETKIHLAIGILDKRELFELIPYLCELSVWRMDFFGQPGVDKKRLSSSRLEKAIDIARQSIKQCKRAWLPEIVFFKDLHECLESRNTGEVGADKADSFSLFLNAEESKSLTEVLKNQASGSPDVLRQHSVSSRTTFCVVGGERGLADEEISYLKSKGFEGVSLGKTILRAKTASIAAASIFGIFC